MNRYVDVAKIGKAVGIKGDLRLQILSDFPEIIIPGREFLCGQERLCVARFDAKKALFIFKTMTAESKARF